MRNLGIAVAVLVVIAAIVAYLSVFTVDPTEQALVFQFGKPKRLVSQPGLNFKEPFIENVDYFDKRVLDIETQPQEVIASDQKRLVVDAFARYRIVNPLLFYQSVRDVATAQVQFGNILESTLRSVLGAAGFQDIVRDKREALMETIAAKMNTKAKAYGMHFVNVRIKRVDLPQSNSEAIYKRMQTEREQQAAEFRAEGEGAARKIRATADRKVTVIKADATGEAEQIRGDGDAERNKIFAAAYSKDPDFFAFYRSMEAYKDALQNSNTRFVLSPSSQFFQYFNDASGGPDVPGTTAMQKQGLPPKGSIAPKDMSKVPSAPPPGGTASGSAP
jgi:modulator of FtsH protease HflC